ncbi:MAG: hypothetical protein FJX80_13725 [Bacteroidetes bacterium]|nr:hypothetical protein [Bacteroidota bacterium]
MPCDEITYILNDARCQAAIDEIEGGMDTLKWLGEYLELYKNVTYAPEGMARIAACNFHGKHFYFISQFAILYMKKHHEVEDPFSNPSYCE